VAAGRKILNGSPLAFGEGGVKERVKNVLNFKKRSRVVIIAAIALVVVLSVGFAVNRAGNSGYDFRGFHVNGYGLGTKIDVSNLTPSTDGSIMYAHNYEGISFDTDENGLVSRFHINVYESGITTMSTPSQNPNGASFADIGYQIQDIENIFGKGKIGWYSEEQGLRSETYFDYSNGKGNAGAISVEFVYTDGEDNGIDNRLVWANAEIRGASVSLTEFEAIYTQQNIVAEDIQIDGESGETTDSVLTRWLTEYLSRLNNLPENHEQAIESFEVTNIETADARGDWVLGYVTYALKPYGDPNNSVWLAGNGEVGAGSKADWIVGKRQEVVLYHDIDGAWHCKGYGTGGYNLSDYADAP
jgi:hypothetical protein